MEKDQRVAIFLSALDPSKADAARSREAELGELLERVVDGAIAAHPDVTITERELVEALAARMKSKVIEELAAIHAADVLLASAAAAKDRVAVARLQAALAAEVRAAASGVRAPKSVEEEASQRLAEQLFAGAADRPPVIADFEGRGDIRGFLRVSAVRECLRLLQRSRREVASDPDELVVDAVSDPVLDRLKEAYREHFSACFADALGRLTPRERTLLRLHAIDRSSIDEIGTIYGVHRATAARWLERARARAAELTEQAIAERLMLDTAEVASVIRLVRSQLDISLERLLGDGER